MNDPRLRIRDVMRRVRLAGALPSSAAIVAETFLRLEYTAEKVSTGDVLANFNDMLRRVWEETLVVLEEHEDRSYAQGIPNEFMSEFPDAVTEAEEVAKNEGFRAGVARLFGSWYPNLRRAFQSISQSRMTRGGHDFELQIETMLTLAGIPFHKQERQNRTDLILPDMETHQRNRTISAVVSLKRTLRERWAEVAEELFNLRSPNVFLFTADEGVSENHVARICRQYNIHLVVWDSVKARFPDEPFVLGYTEWASERLTDIMRRWPPRTP